MVPRGAAFGDEKREVANFMKVGGERSRCHRERVAATHRLRYATRLKHRFTGFYYKLSTSVRQSVVACPVGHTSSPRSIA